LSNLSLQRRNGESKNERARFPTVSQISGRFKHVFEEIHINQTDLPQKRDIGEKKNSQFANKY